MERKITNLMLFVFYFPVLPQQRCCEALLRDLVPRADDHAGLRAVGAVGAELPAAAARALRAPRRAAQLLAAAHQRPTARGGVNNKF